MIDCDYSICTKKVILHTPVEDKESAILPGEDDLSLYQFDSRVARYIFRPRCGCSAFHRSRGNPNRYSVNARCLDDLDMLLARIDIWYLDGRYHPYDQNSKNFGILPCPCSANVNQCPMRCSINRTGRRYAGPATEAVSSVRQPTLGNYPVHDSALSVVII